jgi:hypothetical protein
MVWVFLVRSEAAMTDRKGLESDSQLLLADLRKLIGQLMSAGGPLPIAAGTTSPERYADALVGRKPLPKRQQPPRAPPQITPAIYRNIMRGTK